MNQPPELLRLPRSVLFAIWLDGVGTAGVTMRDLLTAVQGDDEPHLVRGPDHFGPAGGDLADLAAAWAGRRRAVTAILTAAEIPDELPVPGVDRLETAGECLLIEVADAAFAAVPEVVRFGSTYEPGHLVTWDVQEIDPWQTSAGSALDRIGDAEREVRQALTAATRALADVDVTYWTPEAAAAISTLRSGRDLRWSLPPYVDGRRRRILVTAMRLRAIVALASDVDGGGVDLSAEGEPADTLRTVSRTACSAITAAAFSVAHSTAVPPQS